MKQHNATFLRRPGNKMRCIAILFMLFLANAATAQTTVGGVISTNTTYTVAGSPYLLTNNLLVQSGVTLTIQPGVTLRFARHIYMQVDGELRAIGTPADSIIFTADSPGLQKAWAGVRFSDIATDYDPLTGNGCVMDYCIYEGSGYGHRTIQIEACKVKIAHSNIRDCWSDGIVVEGLKQGGAVYLISNRIQNAGNMALWAWDNDWGIIQGNDFYGKNGIMTKPVTIGRAIFVDNHIHGRMVDSVNIRVADTVIVCNNVIEDGHTGLLLQGGDAHIVKCNTFNNNKINIGITCERHPIVINNNFLNYKYYNVCWTGAMYGIYGSYKTCVLPAGSGTFATIDLDSNYWGGISNAQMDTSIWDFQDDFNMKAKISYTPTYGTPVSYSVANCSYTSTPGPGVGVPQAAADNSVQFFPNPFSDNAYLKIRGAVLNEQYRISILDMTGKVVKQVAVTGAEMTRISRDGLPAGVYICQIISPDNQRYYTRVVVQ